MKIKSLVLAAALSPAMLALGQTTTVFYNQGKMSVVGTDPNATVLYIQGDFVSGDNATKSITSDILMTKSRVVLTGDFRHDALTPNAKVFNSSSTSDAVFEFRGTAKQKITTDGETFATIPNKGTGYINFPTLQINNKNQVVLDAALGAQATNLNLTKGTLVLDAARINSANKSKYINIDNTTASSANPDERSALAHLKVTGTINYNNNMLASDSADRSFVRVIVPFDDKGYSKDNGRFASIVGMGIPFEGMYTDYFLWNYLMQPSNENYFGPGNMPLNDRNIVLKAGKGYIIGNNLKGNDFSDYEPNNTSQSWGIGSVGQFNSRFNTGYVFDRAAFAATTNTNNRMGAYDSPTIEAAYTQEKLNTSDITIQLTPGFNYLANPFTSPLDITDLIKGTTTAGQWKVKASSVKNDRDIMNRVWIMNGTSRGSAKDNMFNPSLPMPTNELQLQVDFYLAKENGSTYINENGGTNVLIPALQLFAVYAERASSITIPRSAQAMGVNTFIRSTNTAFDDFVFEIYDVKTETSNRVSVVLRPKTDLISNTEYTNVNKINPAIERSTASSNSKLLQGVASQLYTKSDSSDDPLTVKYIGYTPNVDSKVSTPLYLKPSNIDQEVVIKGYRLESLTNFESVILVDKLLGKEVVMTPETEYKTTVKSTDADDRFTLIFSRGTDGIEDEIENPTKSITSYYANGTLTVTGFEESDFGSVLTVYDLQGRQVAQTKVADFTVNVTANFAPGAFVVKVVGNNSYVAKFLVK